MANTYYLRNDQHTINGLAAYKLTDTKSSGTAVEGFLETGTIHNCDVLIRHLDNSETSLGTEVGETTRINTSYGYLTGTWVCPATNLATTDAIKIVSRIKGGGYAVTYTHVTAQLGMTKILSTTWSFYRWSLYNIPYMTFGVIAAGGLWVDDARYDASDTAISNVSLQAYTDIGLRIKAGAEVVTIGALDLDAGTHKLRVRKGGTTYGIPLITPGGADDSGVRIYDGSNVKTVPKL